MFGAAIAAAAMLCPARASGQAWIMPAGEGTFGITHEYVRSHVHLNREGIGTTTLGSEAFHIVGLEGLYGLVDRVAVDASVVWLATKWTGDRPHGPVDTGIYHGALQDFRFAVRYQLTSGRLATAPFVAVNLPSHSYQVRGHSAFGRNLREVQIGVSAGGDVNWLPGDGYVHGTVSYAHSEHVSDVDLDLSHVDGDFEVGGSVLRRVRVRGFGSWRVMWDGLQLGPQTEHLELTIDHDRFARSTYLQLGGGATFDVGRRAALSIAAFTTVSGRNIHAVRSVVSGLSWKFGGGFKISKVTGPVS